MQTTLSFHAELYPLRALTEAAAAFGAQAVITIEAGAPHHRVTISGDDAARLRQLGHELANYVLALSSGGPEPAPPAANPDPASDAASPEGPPAPGRG
jgi:hypothetical protein